MHSISSLRFQKLDQFNNPVFISSQDKEPDTFHKLKDWHERLDSKGYGTFLPIYSNSEHSYSTIRFKKSEKYSKFTANNVYSLDFTIKKVERNGKIHVNCFLNKVKLTQKAPKVDFGEDLDFSD
jgi:hypothetical protein